MINASLYLASICPEATKEPQKLPYSKHSLLNLNSSLSSSYGADCTSGTGNAFGCGNGSFAAGCSIGNGT